MEGQKKTKQFAKFLHMASENSFIEQSIVLRHPTDRELHIAWVPRITIGTPSSIYLWLQGLTVRIATGKPLSWLPIPELTKWQCQVARASFV